MIRVLILAAATALPPAQHLPTTVVEAPRAKLTLQIARTEDEHELGLMNVKNLPAHTGMVFVFDQDANVEFWMKDTLIPLDMIWVAGDGTVRKVESNVPIVSPDMPDEKIPREDGQGKFVIELPANEAAKDGIVSGTKLSDLAQLH